MLTLLQKYSVEVNGTDFFFLLVIFVLKSEHSKTLLENFYS